ncbi:MAG: hypothetical protein AB2A00_19605 [Myxococcota bacterium]
MVQLQTHAPSLRPRPSWLDANAAILVGFALFVCWWFRFYLTSEPVAAVDIPGHVAAMNGFRLLGWKAIFSFYDLTSFTGYPAFQFYAFLPHWACALVSLPVTFFAVDPLRLTAHVMLVLAAATLPLSVLYAVTPLARELFEDKPEVLRRNRWVLTASACTFSFWYLNHDHQWYGIGAAGVMNVGLFSQAFGWHFMLLHFGALVRLIQTGERKYLRATAAFIALLFITHTMTAVFSGWLVFMSLMWFQDRRGALLKAHIMGFCLAAFWLVPMAAFLGSYTLVDIHRPTGDFLEIFLRYPFHALARSLLSWLHGKFEPLNPTEMLIIFLLVVMAGSRQMRRARTTLAFLVFTVVGLVILTSGFIASSVPMGFHYYRFIAYLFLFLTTLITVAPLLLVRTADEVGDIIPWDRITAPLLGAALAGCFVVTAGLPHYERDKTIKNSTWDHLKNERAVLEWFKAQPQKGRVWLEYFSNYDKYPWLSAHVISSRMLRETGFEPINGLFVQASLAYSFPTGAMQQLKANTYVGPLLYPAHADTTDDFKVQQLKEFGVTHVVLGGDEPVKKLQPHALGEPVVIGPYKILKLLPDPVPPVRPVQKNVAAYMDLRGTVPFKFMELFFFAKQQLWAGWELLDLPRGRQPPPQTQLIILNGDEGKVASVRRDLEEDFKARGLPVPRFVTLDFVQRYTTKHYSVQYQHNPELDDFNDFVKYVTDTKLVSAIGAGGQSSGLTQAAALTWAADHQSFDVTSLQPGTLYRVDYTYFPYWHSSDGDLYRGSAERMFFLPRQANASFTYTRLRSGSTYLGWALTFLALWRWRKREVS